MVGNVAIQQALIRVLKKSYREAGNIMGVHPRTVWQHVNGADRGANVTRWDRRIEKAAAVRLARVAITEYETRTGVTLRQR